MALSSSLCTRRFTTKKLRIPQLSSPTPGRCLSTFISSGKLPRTFSPRATVYLPTLPGHRNYWWSSKTPAPAQDIQKNDDTPPPESTLPPADETSAVNQSSALEVESSASQSPELPLPTGAESLPSSVVDAAASAVSQLPPVQLGDFTALGLTSWSPAGLSTWLLEVINVASGMSWGATIAAAALVTRLMIAPFWIKQVKTAAIMAEHQPRIQELQKQMQDAKLSGDQLALQSAWHRLNELYAELGVHPLVTMMNLFIQVPVQLGMFLAVKRICELPVEQLKTGGIQAFDGLFLDLTTYDPYCILPTLTVAAINVQMIVMAREQNAENRTFAQHSSNIFRVLSLLSIPLMYHLPIGSCIYVLTGVALSGLQQALIRIPEVRSALHIPRIKGLRPKPPTMRETYRWVQEYMDERMKAQQQAAIRDRRERARRRRRQ